MKKQSILTLVFLITGILLFRVTAFAQLRPFDNIRTMAPWIYNPAISFPREFQAVIAYDGRNSNSFTPQSIFAGVRAPVQYQGRDTRNPAAVVGVQYARTSQDIINSSLVSGSFSYQVPLSQRLRAAAGLGAGMSMLNYNFQNLVYLDQQDPLLGNGVGFYNIHLNAGIAFVLDERITFSAGLPRILKENKMNLNEIIIRSTYETPITNGLDLMVAGNLDTYNRNFIAGGDVRLQWRKKLAVLAGGDNFKAYAGLSLKLETIHIGYTYGMNYSKLLNRLPNNQLMVSWTMPTKTITTP